MQRLEDFIFNNILKEDMFDIDSSETLIGEIIERGAKLDKIANGAAHFIYDAKTGIGEFELKDLDKYINVAKRFGVDECVFHGNGAGQNFIAARLWNDFDLKGFKFTFECDTLLIKNIIQPHILSNGIIVHKPVGNKKMIKNIDEFNMGYDQVASITFDSSELDWGGLHNMEITSPHIEFSSKRLPYMKNCKFNTGLFVYFMHTGDSLWNKYVVPYIENPDPANAKNIQRYVISKRDVSQLKKYNTPIYIYREIRGKCISVDVTNLI